MKRNHKKAFENFEIEPSPEVWKRIEEKLPAKKKSRWFFFWILSGIIIIGAAWLYDMKDISLIFSSNHDNVIVQSVQDQSIVAKDIYKTDKYDKKIDLKNRINISKIISPVLSVKKESKNNKSIGLNQQPVNNYFSNKKKPDFEDKFQTSLLLNEEFFRMYSKSFYLNDSGTENDVIVKEKLTETKRTMTRWTVFAGTGISFSSSHNKWLISSEGDDVEITGINDMYFNAGVVYDYNLQIKFSTGVSLITAGQERNASTIINLRGIPGDPANLYSIITPFGNITGKGSEFDHVFFNNPDSVLFPQISQVTPFTDTSEARNLKLRQEFQYIQIPIMCSYKPVEGKIKPYAGIFLSAGYLIKKTIKINERQINYNYENDLSDFLISAGIAVGTDIQITNHLSFFVTGFYQQGLNSIYKDDDKWVPYFIGLGGGISYRISRFTKINF